MSKKPQTKEERDEERQQQRAALDASIAALPGDYTDPEFVVKGMRSHYGDLFTAADEAAVRERVKPPSPAPAPAARPVGIIPPTIGRQVWFWRDGVERKPDLQPEAATVCYVQGDSMVNLQVIGHNGIARSEVDVSLRQPGDPEWSGRHAEWMPFQKGQARAQEAAASK